MWKIKQIAEADFGCEGTVAGRKIKMSGNPGR